jgi:hypothetical protein
LNRARVRQAVAAGDGERDAGVTVLALPTRAGGLAAGLHLEPRRLPVCEGAAVRRGGGFSSLQYTCVRRRNTRSEVLVRPRRPLLRERRSAAR